MSGRRVVWPAVALVAGAEWRRRRRGLLALGVVAGVVAGLVVTGVALARRTSTAPARLVEATALDDARVEVFGPDELVARVEALPEVASSWTGRLSVARLEERDGSGPPGILYLGILAGPPRPPDLLRPVVVRGRLPDDAVAGEVVLSEPVAATLGAGPGARLPVAVLTQEEVTQFEVGFGDPDGPRLDLTVTGVVRLPSPQDQAPVLASAATAEVLAPTAAGARVLVRLAPGADLADLSAALERVVPPPDDPLAAEFGPLRLAPPDPDAPSVAATARVLVAGVLVAVGVGGLAGLLALAQALARHHGQGRHDQRVEADLGLTALDRALARTLPAAAAALVAAATAAGVALAGAGVGPLGALRRSEPSPGWAPHVALIVAGSAGAFVVVVALAFLTARRAGTRRRTPQGSRPAVAGGAPVALAPSPAVAVGLRFALRPARAGGAVRSALLGAILGAAGATAALTFSSSLDRLVATPERWGWPADVSVVDATPAVLDELARDPRFSAVAEVADGQVRVAGEAVPAQAWADRAGHQAWGLRRGRLPEAPGEVVLGTRLADRLDADLGDVLPVGPQGREVEHRVVGVGLGPELYGEGLGASALLAHGTLAELAESQPFVEAMLQVAPGVDAAAVVDDLATRFELTVAAPPGDVADLADLGRLPDLLAAFVGLVAAAALGHALVVTVRRRAADLAVLRALGFTRRQAGATLVAMAGIAAAVGLLVGVPLGLGVGRLVWWAVAEPIGVAPDPDWPVLAVAVLVPCVLAGAVLVAAVPARRAARLRPAALLRGD